jgi:hypothetical protein
MTSSCEHGNGPSYYIKGGGIFWLLERLLASQEWLYSMEVIMYFYLWMLYYYLFSYLLLFCSLCTCMLPRSEFNAHRPTSCLAIGQRTALYSVLSLLTAVLIQTRIWVHFIQGYK